jgi:hypothetical protein
MNTDAQPQPLDLGRLKALLDDRKFPEVLDAMVQFAATHRLPEPDLSKQTVAAVLAQIDHFQKENAVIEGLGELGDHIPATDAQAFFELAVKKLAEDTVRDDTFVRETILRGLVRMARRVPLYKTDAAKRDALVDQLMQHALPGFFYWELTLWYEDLGLKTEAWVFRRLSNVVPELRLASMRVDTATRLAEVAIQKVDGLQKEAEALVGKMKEIESTQRRATIDLIQTLGLFAAVIAFVVVGVQSALALRLQSAIVVLGFMALALVMFAVLLRLLYTERPRRALVTIAAVAVISVAAVSCAVFLRLPSPPPPRVRPSTQTIRPTTSDEAAQETIQLDRTSDSHPIR